MSHTANPPVRDAATRAILDDPAFRTALSEAVGFGRLSDGDIRAMRQARRNSLVAGGVTALAFALGLGSWQCGWLTSVAPAVTHYQTQRGEELTVALADGSTVQLNGATSVDVTLDADQRQVALKRGEAYFDIAHDARRPFIVDAGGSRARVLGTAFDIDLAQHEVRISVYRGRVRFGGAGRDGVDVPAGWRSRYSGGIAVAPVRFDTARQNWRQSWLDIDDMRLGDLVETLNRRAGPAIQPPPSALAGTRVSGRFKLDDPGGLIDALGAAYGFDVACEGNRLRLVPQDKGDTKSSPR